MASSYGSQQGGAPQHSQGLGYQGAGSPQQYPSYQGSGSPQQYPHHNMSPKKSRKWFWLGGGAALLVLFLGGCVALVASFGTELSDDVEMAVGEACAGTGAPGAGSYVGGRDGFVLFGQDDVDDLYLHDKFNPRVVEDQPEELADIRTVLCMDAPTSIVVGVCEVTTVGVLKEDYEIVYKERVGRLVDPSTGEVVAETTVASIPEEDCEGRLSDGVSKDDFIADVPTGKDFNGWLESTL